MTTFSPSADCEVAGNPTYGGIDAAGGTPLTITLNAFDALDDRVTSWDLAAIACDVGSAPDLVFNPGAPGDYTFTPEAANAEGRMYVLRSTINNGLAHSLITIYVASSLITTRADSTDYALGDRVVPAVPNGHLYVCVRDTGSSAGAPPASWPTEPLGVVIDGGITWQEVGSARTPRDSELRELESEHGLALIAPNGTVNVQELGAGTLGAAAVHAASPTQDDLAFGEALAILRALGGGTLHAPVGRYILTRPLGPCTASVTIRGDGAGDGFGTGTILDFYLAGRAVYAFEGGGSNASARFRMADLWVRCLIPVWRPEWEVEIGQLTLPRQGSSNGVIYRCTTAGTTASYLSGEQRWATLLGSTTTDGGAVWEAVGATGAGIPPWTAQREVQVNLLIAPTVPNGHYYVCTAAGTTGTTEPSGMTPWPTTLGSTITDGTAIWTPRHGTWAASQTVAVGDRVVAGSNSHIYECTTAGDNPVTDATIPAFAPDVGESYPEGGLSTVVWTEVGVLGNGTEALYQVATWSPELAVVEDQMILPRVANGHWYVALDDGTTSGPDLTAEPGVTMDLGTDPPSPSVPVPGDWPVTPEQESRRYDSEKYLTTIVDGTGGTELTWERKGFTLVGVTCILGSLYHLERVTVSGFQISVFLGGVEGAEIAHLSNSSSDTIDTVLSGVPFPSPGSIGVMVGANAFPNTTNGVTVHDSLFNAPEIGIWDYNDVNHRFTDNIGQLPAFGMFGKITGSNTSIWENNVTADPHRFTVCAMLCDGRPYNLAIRSNYFVVSRGPGIVFESLGPIGFELTNNEFSCGFYDGDDANTVFALAGMNYVTNAFTSFGNDFAYPDAAFDADPGASAIVVQLGNDNTARVGVNNARPRASLDVYHQSSVGLPALALRDDAGVPQLEHRILNVRTIPSVMKQMARQHVPVPLDGVESTEAGVAAVTESVELPGADPVTTADVCLFKVAPDTVVFARYRVVARRVGAFGMAVWTGHWAIYRDGNAAIVEADPAAQDVAIASGAAFATAPAIVDVDATTIGLRLTGLDVEEDSQWQAELDLQIVSVFAQTPSIASAVSGGGFLTISGASLQTWGVDTSSVLVLAGGAVVPLTAAAIEGGGSIDDDTIVIDEMILPAGAAAVRVIANGKTSAVETIV